MTNFVCSVTLKALIERVIEAYTDDKHEHNVEVTKKMTKDIEFILYNNKDLIEIQK